MAGLRGEYRGPGEQAKTRRAGQVYEARRPFTSDAEALAAYDRYLREQVPYQSGMSEAEVEASGGASLTAAGTQMARQLQRAQGGLATSFALSNRANPMAALREAQQQQTGMDYAGAREGAIGKALQEYQMLLAQKKSRNIAMMQARNQMQDQYIGAGTSAAGALLAQYAARRGENYKAPA